MNNRWRKVLKDLDAAVEVGVADVVVLLDWTNDDLGHRPVEWFIGIARAALDEGLGDKLWLQRCVLTEDGTRIVPPLPHHEGELLLRSSPLDSLAKRLGLVHVLHPEYLSQHQDAVAVRKWLDEKGMLHDAPDAENTLQALATRGEEKGPIRVGDETLCQIRDALSELAESRQRELGAALGKAIEVDVVTWKGDKRSVATGRLANAYIPTTIEERKDGWGKAAGHAPGLMWVHSRYEDVLRRAPSQRVNAGDRRVLAAKALFTLLGAETAPRLEEPARYETKYGDPASVVVEADLTRSQRATHTKFQRYATHLKGDRLSPDLVAVVRDIRRDRKARARRQRARALIATLSREWDRRYADFVAAAAVFSDRTWHQAGSIPTTWLGHLMDEPWMTNELGQAKAPTELGVRTSVTEAIFGDDRSFFASELNESDARSPVVRALGIETDPQVSAMVDQLAEMRDEGRDVDEQRVNVRYAAIAAACTTSGELVGDITVRQLRARFGQDRLRPGLVFAASQWLPPSRVFRGSRIFGNRRAFVSERSAADKLWDVLRIAQPSITESMVVLEEIATTPGDDDEHILLNTYVYLDANLPKASAREQVRLRSLPLMTGLGWSRIRPVYAVVDEALARALATEIPIWLPPLPLTGIRQLLQAVDVTLLPADAFSPVVRESAVEAGDVLRSRFRVAVGLLRDWLARHDRGLYEAREVSWEALADAAIAVDRDLQLELPLARRVPIVVPARAHVTTRPLTFYFVDEKAVGADEAGGRTIAQLFSKGDADKLALAWSRAWMRAVEGQRATVSLAEDIGVSVALDDLFNQATTGRPKRVKAEPRAIARPDGRAAGTLPTPLPARRLKDINELSPTAAAIAASGGRTRRQRQSRGLQDETQGSRAISTRSVRAPASAPLAYSAEQKECLALQVLQLAINGESAELRDYRHLRGVGADALDKLRRYFEIKAYYGPLPDEITLTGAEAERAVRERERFFLVVVAGLEKGYETVVKIYSDPVRSLTVLPNTSVTLAGITRSGTKALEVRLGREGEQPAPVSSGPIVAADEPDDRE